MFRLSISAFVLGCAALAPAGDHFAPAAAGSWPVEAAEAAGYPYDVSYGGYPPGGYEGRIGKPYYWSVPGGTVPLAAGQVAGHGPAGIGPASVGTGGCGCNKRIGGASENMAAGGYAAYGVGSAGSAGGPGGDPYTYHFGPGFYRSNEFGHYRFPYYSYRRPWYDVGHPVRVRDTNLPW